METLFEKDWKKLAKSPQLTVNWNTDSQSMLTHSPLKKVVQYLNVLPVFVLLNKQVFFFYQTLSTGDDCDTCDDCYSRMLGEMPDLDDLETKLKSYYAKIEKDKGLNKR